MHRKEKPPILSLTAGIIAGGVEGFITYPTEYIKTRLQIPGNTFKGPIDALFRTAREKGVFGLYKGLTPLVIGNASKAGVRFLSFDQCKRVFLDQGMNSASAMVLAGLAAGMIEAILVVTPSETIKTKLIHDQNQSQPRFKGLSHGVKTIIHEEGLRGIYRGLSAVIARQGANSAVRMSSYGVIRDRLAKYYPIDANNKPIIPWYTNFFSGALAGILTVYTTMPLDVVKTRLQSLSGSGSIFSNLKYVVQQDGVLALWKGATPRLGRLIFSGGNLYFMHRHCFYYIRINYFNIRIILIWARRTPGEQD